jgi:hypothetical protein
MARKGWPAGKGTFNSSPVSVMGSGWSQVPFFSLNTLFSETGREKIENAENPGTSSFPPEAGRFFTALIPWLPMD